MIGLEDECLDSQLNSEPKVVIKRLSAEVIEKYDKIFVGKYFNEKKEELNENISKEEYLQFLGLIPTQELATKPFESLSETFPIRRIARIGQQLKDDSNRILFNKNLIIEQNLEKMVRKEIKRKKKTNKSKKIRAKVLSKEDKKLEELREQKKRILKFVSQFETTSKLSDRLVRTLDLRSLSAVEVLKASNKQIRIPGYEKSSNNYIKYNHWNGSNIERQCMKSELAFRLKGKDVRGKKETEYRYVFTRRQKLEKLKKMKCRLNWKSRLIQLNCREMSLDLTKITTCFVCCAPLSVNHSCEDCEPSNQSERQPLIDSNSFEITNPSLDLTEMIAPNVEDNGLENCPENQMKTSVQNEVKAVVEVEEEVLSMDNTKRPFVAIDLNLAKDRNNTKK